MNKKSNPQDIFQSQEFQELFHKRKILSFFLTFLIVGIYVIYILIDAFDRQALAIKIFGGITLGIYLGIGVIIIGWITTGVYVWWANNKYDACINQVRKSIGGDL